MPNAGNSNKLEELPIDKQGNPVPILGTLDGDPNSYDISATITTNKVYNAANSNPLLVGGIYILTVTAVDLSAVAPVAVDILHPDNGSNELRLCGISGLTYIFKARAVGLKVSVVASLNATGVVICLQRLA